MSARPRSAACSARPPSSPPTASSSGATIVSNRPSTGPSAIKPWSKPDMAVLTEEQTMLRDAAKGWTQDSAPVAALRKLRDSGSKQGFDPATWSEMGAMGWAGVIVPEDFDGSAFGYLGLGLILEETGRNLVASPLLSTALVSASA